MSRIYAFFIFLFFLKAFAFGQGPTCPSPLVYMQYGNTIMAFNTTLPLSPGTNPFSTGVPAPPGAGLTVMPNIHGGTLSPTFYSTGPGNTYYYWSGASWVNTNVTVNGGGINLGGCGTAIYSILGNNVHVSSVNSTSTTFAFSVSTVVADLVPDCDCNIFIFSSGFLLKKYDPTGVLLATYTLTGLPGNPHGGGYAIVGNNVYCQVGSAIQVGTIGTGNTIAFTALTGTNSSPSDWASCSVALNSTPVIATVQVNGSSCQNATVTATSNSAVTYSWSGPGVPSAQTTSAIVTNSTGVISCTVFSSGCGVPPTLSLSVAPGSNSCISVTSASITCASLGSATVTAPGTGPFSFTWNPGGQIGSVATGLSPGTYTVTIYDAFFNLTYTATTTFNSLIPLTGSLSYTDATCNNLANGSATVTSLSGGSGNQTYLWTNGVTSFTQAGATGLSAGVWSLTVSDLLTACSFSQSFFVNQPSPLVLNLSASTPSTCLGGSIVLTGTTSGGTPGYTYTWTNGPAFDTFTVNETFSGPYVYTLTSNDANNCSTSNSVLVNFIQNPTITVSNVSVCPLVFGTLTANGASTYTWNGTFAGTVFSDNPLVNTQYSVVGSALGCTAAASASIILHPLPMPVFQNNSPVCNGQALVLIASGGTGYQWNGPAFTSALSSPTIFPANPGNSGVYNLTVTSVNGCTASTAANLTVHPTPTVTATGATVCTSQTLNLSSNSDPANTLLWTGPAAFQSPLSNPSYFPPTLNHSGTYTLVVTSAQGCTNAAFASVLVVPPPSLTVGLSSSLLCSQAFNGSKNTTTLSSSGANTYTIATSPDMSNPNPGGPISQLTVIPPYTGPGTATVWGSNGVCTVFKTLTFSIIPNPTVTVTPTPVICAGQSYTYTSQGAGSYTWSGSGGITTYNNGGVAVTHPTVNSVFSVYGSSLGCNSASQTSTITVNPIPIISVGPTSPTICLHDQVTLSTSGTAGSFLWSPGTGLSNTTTHSVQASPASNQTYTVTAFLNSCSNTAVTTVSVFSLPVPTLHVSQHSVCTNELITFNGEGGLTYEWRGPNSIYFAKQNFTLKMDNGHAVGGIYTLTVTDDKGCKNSATEIITVFPAPQGSLFGVKKEGCVPLCSEYKFEPNGLHVSSTWTVNTQVFPGKFEYCFHEPGHYSLNGLLTDDVTGCANTVSIEVNAFARPVADFVYLPLHPIENLDEVIFTNRSVSEGESNYNWFFSNHNGYQSNLKDPSYLFSEAGEYPVVLVISDKNGCADTVVKAVKIEPDFNIYIPDAFTPNGDGRNDVFSAVVRSTYLFTLSVHDRWGQRIFYSTSPASGWDGRYLDADCKSDVYSWTITLSTFAGEKKEYMGHVTLVR